MDALTVLSIVLATLAALILVWYHYFFKTPKKGSTKYILAALRFISVLGGLLLLINPTFVDREYYLEKADLILLVDQSSSMGRATDTDTLSKLVAALRGNPSLEERFNIHQYGFGREIQQTDSIALTQDNTDIANALSQANGLFLGGPKALVLLSDGNQTLGRDYEHITLAGRPLVHSMVIGDTTQYEDISIGLLNANGYAFLNNSFPVEATIRYQGPREVARRVTLSLDGRRVHQERVTLGPQRNSQTLNLLVKAERVGAMSLTLEVEPLEGERNTANNLKRTALEVIDERSEVVLVHGALHPDVGALKKSIETNRQRRVTLVKASEATKVLEGADLLILYQPTRSFAPVYEFIKKSGINHFTLTGSGTDWNFLNRAQESFARDTNNQREEIIPVLNPDFNLFALGDFKVGGLPPLEGPLGEIQWKKERHTLLYQQIRGVELEKPLLALLTDGRRREAVLLGENIWRWRAQAHRDNQSFAMFDDLMGQLMRYLGADQQRSRLEVEHPPLFENAQSAHIRASYFDQNYQFDPRARLSITVEAVENGFRRTSPLLLKNNHYGVDLSFLIAGEYRYTLEVEGEDLRRSGEFTILDFDPEKQFISANPHKLERLAKGNNGRLYHPDQWENLIGNLSSAPALVPLQKSRENVVSLIDFNMLLGLIVLALTGEWGIRKYNGLM